MFKNLLFKTTKPLVLGRWSTGTSKDIIEINNNWFELVPVVEMPQIRFSSIEGISAVDLIAGNIAASCWLEAPPISTCAVPENTKEKISIKPMVILEDDVIDLGYAPGSFDLHRIK